ncbi:MAG: GrpB family protein [Pseudomonadota bacterium]
MALTSTIVPYDPGWPKQYEDEAKILAPIFHQTLVQVHHIGSTAIAGLSAKPEIDILVVVECIQDASEWSKALAELRYRRGGDLSVGHLFYKKDVSGVRTHKVHVCTTGHEKIQEMIHFRNFLRTHADTRAAYQALKLQLERDNTLGIAQYLKGKAPFIAEVLQRAGK